MFTSRVTKLKRLRDSAPENLRSPEGRQWVRAVTLFFSRELHDRKIVHVIEQIVEGGTAASAQLTRRQRRAEVLELLDGEIANGAMPRAIPPAEVEAALATRREFALKIAIAMIAALLFFLLIALRVWDRSRQRR
jgi:hypothetical protein